VLLPGLEVIGHPVTRIASRRHGRKKTPRERQLEEDLREVAALYEQEAPDVESLLARINAKATAKDAWARIIRHLTVPPEHLTIEEAALRVRRKPDTIRRNKKLVRGEPQWINGRRHEMIETRSLDAVYPGADLPPLLLANLDPLRAAIRLLGKTS
jgi:hypothetical protein